MSKPFAAAALSLAAWSAQAQSIPIPASSVYSGARGVIAITPVDLSGYATTADLASVSNVASSALGMANTAYSYGYNAYINQGYGRPWSQWFEGQLRGPFVGAATGFGYWVQIDGTGAIYVLGPPTRNVWTYVGRPTAGEVVRWWSDCITGVCAHDVVEVFPVNVDARGIPADFTAKVPNAAWYYLAIQPDIP